jgi:hypothetical protein
MQGELLPAAALVASKREDGVEGAALQEALKGSV